MSVLVFVLPLPPNMANARLHWKAKLRARQEYEQTCELLRMAKRLPRVPASPFPSATIAAHFAVWSLNDEDNLMARAKWPLDWIVKAGYLLDDRKKCLSWAGLPTQEVNRKAPALTLTLTPR